MWSVNPDGTQLRQLTTGPYAHFKGLWSPDAKKIISQTDQDWTTADFKMVVTDLSSGYRSLIRYGTATAWSNTLNIVSYLGCIACGGSGYRAYVMTPEGDNPTEVLTNGGILDWSPTGDSVLVAYSDLADSPPRAILVIATYPSLVPLDTIPTHMLGSASWSNTRGTIALSMEDSGTGLQSIFTYEIANSQLTQLTIGALNEHLTQPHWSPSDLEIVYLATPVGSSQGLLHVVDITSGVKRILLNDNTVSSCDWSDLAP